MAEKPVRDLAVEAADARVRMMPDDDYAELEALLIKHEGLRLTPYLCPAGKLTIGVGRNLDDVGLSAFELGYIRRRRPDWRIGDAITREEARLLLWDDLARVVGELRGYYPRFASLSKARQFALIDMCFNLGLPRFKAFVQMDQAVRMTDFAWAAEEMLNSKWAAQVGERARELAAMMREG